MQRATNDLALGGEWPAPRSHICGQCLTGYPIPRSVGGVVFFGCRRKEEKLAFRNQGAQDSQSDLVISNWGPCDG